MGEYMKRISDTIEQFILSQLVDGKVDINRNELANYFNCAPSQINYVLTTRFTPLKGYDIESRRGGGGYVRITQINISDKTNYVHNAITQYIKDSIDYTSAVMLLDGMKSNNIIGVSEYRIILTAISNKSLSSPINNEDKIRAKILTNILLEKCKEI